MRFLWKSQLKRKQGKLLPKNLSGKNTATRKERFVSHTVKRSTYTLVLFLWCLFLGTTGYLVLFSSYLALASWQVTGLSFIPKNTFQKSVDQELAHRYLGFIERNRFFLFQPKRLERFLKDQYPLVQRISVKRIFPDRFEIAVEERETLVLWCVEGTCAHVLEDGSVIHIADVYQKEENQSRTLTVKDESGQPLKFGAGVFDESFGVSVMALRQELRGRFGLATNTTLSFSSRFANELRVQTEAGWWVYINTRMPLATTLDALELLLEKEIPSERLGELDYIDLRTENRIFYRYHDGSGSVGDNPVKVEEVQPENKAAKENMR
ncbi:MAG: FtsQ-type POTRA domain-containing protein [Candidatus Moranbacteria bacterium]|nr:FtsQ-type POTRA domain-containing protein [Candidatus Moranbacteria bacterium]